MWLPFAGSLQNKEELVECFKAESPRVVKASTDQQENSKESGHSIPQFQFYKHSASTYPMQSTMLGIAVGKSLGTKGFQDN